MDWLDYLTPVTFKSDHAEDPTSALRLLRDDPDDELLNLAKWTWTISQQKKKEHHTQFGRTYQVDLPSKRFFVVHEPVLNDKDLQQPLPLLVFFHGLNSSAWFCALAKTGWLELACKHKFFVVFGQGQGTFFRDGPQRDQQGGLNFGDLFWEIEDPKADFDYLDSLLDYMKKEYSHRLNADRIYYMGYSNGALFSSNVAVHYGRRIFAALCNHCGGFGGRYNEEKMLQPRNTTAPLPIYILTGSDDAYRESCEKAKFLFEEAQCPVVMDVVENRAHSYYRDREEFIWTQFFLKHKRSSPSC